MKTWIGLWRTTAWIVAAWLGVACGASATTYDLTADWSNISNPNGVWSLNEGTNPLPFVQDYVPGTTGTVAVWTSGYPAYSGLTGDQNAWAASPFPVTGHVPVWLKADAEFAAWPGIADLQAGDVVVHGRCCSDLPGTGEANVTWTSDVAGLATISGATWFATTATNRNVDWNIYINGSLVTGGNVGGADAYDRSNPFDFDLGFGGAGVLSFNAMPGDVVMFEARKGANSPFDHFIGVDLRIDVTSVPEPLTGALLVAGIAGLGVARRKARSA